MRRDKISFAKLDWVMVLCYLLLVFFGWMNIYASSVSETAANIFSLSSRSGNQFMWICIALFTATLIVTVIDAQFYIATKWIFYLLICLMLVAVLIFGTEVNGSKSWLRFGAFAIQPAEFSKITTALCLAFTMSRYNFSLFNPRHALQTTVIIGLPALLIMMEPEIGTIMVYCGLIFMLFREGMSGKIILFIGVIALLFIVTLVYSPFVSILIVIGMYGLLRGFMEKRMFRYIISFALFITASAFIPSLLRTPWLAEHNTLSAEVWVLILIAPWMLGSVYKSYRKKRRSEALVIVPILLCFAMIFSENFIFEKVLMPHHRDRIENLLGITQDLSGAGYNVHQSQIAIGSGGLTGKGFLQGTQTKFDFIPEQSTDFIFCTIGEEWGFVGSVFVIGLFFVLITRIILSAEKQKEKSYRIFGYCVASYLFMHVFVNIGMTIGIMPVIGIPLPLISYGGSSLLTFTILIFIYIRFDLERKL